MVKDIEVRANVLGAMYALSHKGWGARVFVDYKIGKGPLHGKKEFVFDLELPSTAGVEDAMNRYDEMKKFILKDEYFLEIGKDEIVKYSDMK